MKRHATWIVILSLLLGLPAAAGHRDRDRDRRDGEHARWARVLRSTPIHERVRVVTPVRECWTERVSYERPHRDRHHRRHSRTPALVGATLGGLLGSEMGHDRRERRVATLMGALIGGSVGHDIGRRHGRKHGRHRDAVGYRHEQRHDRRHEQRHEQRCETREEVSWERQVVGYDVDYKYRGRIHHTRLADDPGRRMKVDVDVKPRR
ncbi:MAG: glycine zipper 2TM domain-containing protein [Deltaproteobacteria bacterium]|nr:glycine zipper 2TM domain-containing protein [Deltaproteobacteria bacterium]MBW2422093.1 glycine zipper 2TM domain-containing protein [Deltaproteobacteria bacterium]